MVAVASSVRSFLFSSLCSLIGQVLFCFSQPIVGVLMADLQPQVSSPGGL